MCFGRVFSWVCSAVSVFLCFLVWLLVFTTEMAYNRCNGFPFAVLKNVFLGFPVCVGVCVFLGVFVFVCLFPFWVCSSVSVFVVFSCAVSCVLMDFRLPSLKKGCVPRSIGISYGHAPDLGEWVHFDRKFPIS